MRRILKKQEDGNSTEHELDFRPCVLSLYGHQLYSSESNSIHQRTLFNMPESSIRRKQVLGARRHVSDVGGFKNLTTCKSVQQSLMMMARHVILRCDASELDTLTTTKPAWLTAALLLKWQAGDFQTVPIAEPQSRSQTTDRSPDRRTAKTVHRSDVAHSSQGSLPQTE